jgi:hypothetical protein
MPVPSLLVICILATPVAWSFKINFNMDEAVEGFMSTEVDYTPKSPDCVNSANGRLKNYK